MDLWLDRSLVTLPKFNGWNLKMDSCQKESPITGCHFQVPC